MILPAQMRNRMSVMLSGLILWALSQGISACNPQRSGSVRLEDCLSASSKSQIELLPRKELKVWRAKPKDWRVQSRVPFTGSCEGFYWLRFETQDKQIVLLLPLVMAKGQVLVNPDPISPDTVTYRASKAAQFMSFAHDALIDTSTQHFREAKDLFLTGLRTGPTRRINYRYQ
jgi:hypothetical protein